MSKELKPYRLYGQDVDFIVRKGGIIKTKEDLFEFLGDNMDLIQLIYSYEDDLIKVGGTFDKDETVDKMLKKMYRNIKTEGCGFDEKKYKEKDFYNIPIIEFKKLFN